ncbi:MAG: proline iminopeptidase-family hydrolase [Woeseiaceae bacterium]
MKKRLLGLAMAGLGTIAQAETPTPGEGFVDVPGGPVWFKVSGDGAGLPLLVLHGGPGGTSCGQSRLEMLGDERPIIRYDQLGSGRSGRPENVDLWQADLIVERLHTLRTELGLDDFHIVGHSWGGALAAAYVIAKGTDGIASVTLSSPLLSTPDWIADANYLRTQLPEDVQATLAHHEAAGTVDSDEYKEATAVFYERHIYAGERNPSPVDCDGVPGNSFIYQYMWGPTEFYATGNLVDFDVTDRLKQIDVPVLFMAGEFDEARPQRLAEYQKLIPGSRLEVIADAAHASLSKKPDEYRAILESFLDSVEAKRRRHD